MQWIIVKNSNTVYQQSSEEAFGPYDDIGEAQRVATEKFFSKENRPTFNTFEYLFDVVTLTLAL